MIPRLLLFIAAATGGNPQNPAHPQGADHLQAARSLYAANRSTEATAHYWQAIDCLADSAIAAALERDIHYLFDSKEAAEWPKLEPHERASWVRRFWARRAAEQLVSEEELLSDHYERIDHARTFYRRSAPIPPGLARAAPWDYDTQLDDRAPIYIRLGAPFSAARPCYVGTGSYRAWFFLDEERGFRTVYFFTPDSRDWDLVTRAPPGWDLARPWLGLCVALPPGATLDRPFQFGGTDWSAALSRLERKTRLRKKYEGTDKNLVKSERHGPTFDRRLAFGYEWLFFRAGTTGALEATLAFAAPVEHLDCQQEDASRTCDIEARASIFDRDTVIGWRRLAKRVDLSERANWIFGHFGMPAAPGVWEYRVALFQPPSLTVQRFLRGNRSAGEFSLPDLEYGISLSSLVLAWPGHGDWIRGAHALDLNPLHAFRPGATVELYYEIYGMPEEETYVTEIMLFEGSEPPRSTLDPPDDWIHKVTSTKRSALSLRFEESGARGSQPWLARRKTLALTDIERGDYVLLLGITPASGGRTVYRATSLRIYD